jgi:hypothetical protein
MSYKYEDVLNAENPQWKPEAKAYLDRGIQFAIANIPREEVRDCIAFAQNTISHASLRIRKSQMRTIQRFSRKYSALSIATLPREFQVKALPLRRPA